MSRKFALLSAVFALVFAGAGWGGRTPAARVLEIKGKAEVVEAKDLARPAAVYGTIYADERIVVEKNAQVTLVFRGDGHLERIVAPGTYQVFEKGCKPSKGVEQVAMPEENRVVVGKLSKGPRGIVQGGVVMARAPAPRPKDDGPTSKSKDLDVPPNEKAAASPEMGEIRPIVGSTVLTAKPVFSWPAVPKAKKYTLCLFFLGNQVWTAESEATQLEYAGETPLKAGALYAWEIAATVDGKSEPIGEGAFHTASDRQRASAAEIDKLLDKSEPLYLAVAALWYKQNEMLCEAIAVNEKLAKLTPNAAIYQELAELYARAGAEKAARAAEEKAVELEKKTEK